MAEWQKGKGWGCIWGSEDEICALNAITSGSVLVALKLVKNGKIADLGVMVDRRFFRWTGQALFPLGALHYLEQLSRERVFESVYFAVINKIKGSRAWRCHASRGDILNRYDFCHTAGTGNIM